MTLLRFERGENLFVAEAGAASRPARVGGAGVPPVPWWPRFDALHRRAVALLLLGLLAWGGTAPASLAAAAGAGVLLVGGALIGIPHGSSDFVVAHRLMRPRLGPRWLPVFLTGYLAVAGAMLVSWRVMPGITFLCFLGISAFHFGSADEVEDGPDAAMCCLARATTPIVPIFLVHPVTVASIVGPMSDRPATEVVATLESARGLGLALYAVLLCRTVLGAMLAEAGPAWNGPRTREAAELLLLAAAACLLPPFVTFTVYFCLMHAVRHMADLGRQAHPANGSAALGLAAAIVLPSALVCCALLAGCWDAVAGALGTERLLALALQLTASLTVPHVGLEWWAGRGRAGAA